MGMIIVLLCGAVLGTTIRLTAVPLPATTTAAATSTSTSVFGWCAVLGGPCNPFSLFFPFYPYSLFFLFSFLSRLRAGRFFWENGVNVKFYEGDERVIGYHTKSVEYGLHIRRGTHAKGGINRVCWKSFSWGQVVGCGVWGFTHFQGVNYLIFREKVPEFSPQSLQRSALFEGKQV